FQSETIAGKNPSTQISKSFPLICLFLIQNFLIALFYWISYARVNDPYISDTLTPVPFPISLIIPLLLVAAVIMIKRVLRLIQNEIETKTQLNSLRHVEELLHTIRAQRHNFSHELQVVYGLLEVEAFQEAREYIRGSMAEIAATSEIIKTDNLGITALLQTKTGLAEAGKIKFNIEVKTSLQDLPLESRDASIIIGNLIDNALDAVKGLIPEQRRVDIVLARDLAGYVIDVKNCGPAIKPELIEKIFAPEFSTKGEGRGMGLYSVKNLVEKYKGEIRVSSEPGCTCFRVLIPHRN
ncbi:MAG: sensor histidine kinase, partial [Bacillota bacterium]